MRIDGHTNPIGSYSGPLPCHLCGGPADRPAGHARDLPGARQTMLAGVGWRECAQCLATDPTRDLYDLIHQTYGPLSAHAVRATGVRASRVLIPYSSSERADPLTDPGARWHHLNREWLTATVRRAHAAYWGTVTPSISSATAAALTA